MDPFTTGKPGMNIARDVNVMVELVHEDSIFPTLHFA